MADQPELEIHLLGSFVVRMRGSLMPRTAWRFRKAAGIVKLLALEDSLRRSRDDLIEALWPERDGVSGQQNYDHALHVARRIFEPNLRPREPSAFLHTEGDVLMLGRGDNVWIDVAAFQAAADRARRERSEATYRHCIAAYTGGLLPEDVYEPWTEQARFSLHNLYAAVAEEAAQYFEANGYLDSAVSVWEGLFANDATDEQAAQHLMLLHTQRGERARARRVFNRHASALKRDLDAQPDAETERIRQRINQQRTNQTHPLGLTARELQLARLVAEGYTNRQIAAELEISPRTADAHVRAILLKLGVPSRLDVRHRLDGS